MASLANGESHIEVPVPSDDVKVMASALREFGAQIKGEKVTGGTPQTPSRPVWCGESGATIRFITAYASIARGGYSFLYGSRRLHERPIGPLLDAIRLLGGWAESALGNDRPPVIVKGGGLKGGTVEVNASESSQYISALLMVSPSFERGAIISAVNAVSRPYIEITMHVMKNFGVEVKSNGSTYEVQRSSYSPSNFKAPPDASSASFFIVLAVLSGRNALIEGIKKDPPQPDLPVILGVLKRLGWSYEFFSHGLRVYRGYSLNAELKINLKDSPDLLPPLSALGLKLPVRITGVEHARGKESDRIHSMVSELGKLGAKAVELEDGLLIRPPERPVHGAILNGWKDHRVVMALATADAALELGSTIDGYEEVSKSYPNFFNELAKNGYKAVINER